VQGVVDSHLNLKKDGDKMIDVDRVLALEANLRVFESELIALRELVRSNPNYKGDWRQNPQWKKTRRKYRMLCSSAQEILKKEHNVSS